MARPTADIKVPRDPFALYLSHGGGPLPLLGDPGHREMVDALQQIASAIERPSAMVVVSAHWESEVVAVTSGRSPSLIYDYYGFSERAYAIEYPVSGNPELATHIAGSFEDHGISVRLDEDRGFDHGLFVPLKMMYPDAAVPCVQVSLGASLDPKGHIEIGNALRDVLGKHTLLVGSGFSFHNMQEFADPSPGADAQNEAFEEWLLDTCSSEALDEPEREKRLANWENAPFARFCHPREEHLLPLHVCYGAVRRRCEAALELSIMGRRASVFLW